MAPSAVPNRENGSDGDVPVCRMCFVSAEEADEELISPCCCRGSLAYVHYECILRHYECRGIWCDLNCPTCEFPYSANIAIQLGQFGVAQAEEEFEPESLEVAEVLVSLGSAHGLASEVERQRELLERALTILQRDLGPDDPEVGRALVGLGFAHGALGDVELQCEMLERALEIAERAHGPDSPEVAETLMVLANAFARLEDGSRQLDLYQRALKIYEDSCGPSHSGVAHALMGIGNAYGELGEQERKRDLLHRAHKLMLQIYGPDHIQVATVLANLGNALASLGQHPGAICLLWRARCIFLREFGETDRDSQLANESLEELAAPTAARQGGLLLQAAYTSSPGGAGSSGGSGSAAGSGASGVSTPGNLQPKAEGPLPMLGAQLLRAALAEPAESGEEAARAKAAAGAALLRVFWSD